MDTYWMSLTYTADSWRSLIDAGAGERQAAVIRVLAELGADLDGMWWELESHSLHLLVRADDPVALSSLSIFDLAAGIAVSVHIRRLLSVEQTDEALRRAEDLKAKLEASSQ